MARIHLLHLMVLAGFVGCPETEPPGNAAGDDDSINLGGADDDTSATQESDGSGWCGDGEDNDGDGLADCEDPDCAGMSGCGDDDDSLPGDDDDTSTGDDDTVGGDDDTSTGDDDSSTGDDDTSTGDDDDTAAGDDDTATGDDDTVPTDGDADGWPAPGDCDDTDPLVSPAAAEVCSGGVDDDCDGDADCLDPECEALAGCVTDDPYEPNDNQAAAWDLTTMGGQTLQVVLCEPSPDWWRICLGEGGSYTAAIEDFDNPSYIGPPTDTHLFSGSTPTGFSLLLSEFGLEIDNPPGFCHWYTIELSIVNPTPCP